jgi:hypothetical protein
MIIPQPGPEQAMLERFPADRVESYGRELLAKANIPRQSHDLPCGVDHARCAHEISHAQHKRAASAVIEAVLRYSAARRSAKEYTMAESPR